MAFDAGLTTLTRDVRETFGPDVWNEMRDRALVLTRRQLPDSYWSEESIINADEVFYGTFKRELRRLLSRH